MGAKVSLFGALAIEALTKLVNIAGTFNPGNIGTYEGGNMLIVKMFGLTGATGLTLAFARRLRAIFWAAVGGLCLVVLAKTQKQDNLVESAEDIMQIEPEPNSPKESHTDAQPALHSHIAVILANKLDAAGFGSPMPQVGALPILLRTILGAQKAGACANHRCCRFGRKACGYGTTCSELVVSLATSSGVNSLRGRHLFRPCWRSSLREVQGHLVLIAGDRVYHPSLHRRAGEWDGRGDALTLVTDRELVGICALSREVSIDLSRRCPAIASSIEELHDGLTVTHSVETEPVPEDKWQRIVNEQQRLSAEQKLNSWLVKPTDGIFARTNRRISIPISRQIIPFPITPNMVSLFTLGVSFAAGVFLRARRLLEYVVGRSAGLVVERSRRMRRRSRPFETSGIRFRMLVGDDVRQPLLLVHPCGHDDRARQEFRQPDLSGMGRLPDFRRDRQFPHDRPAASSVGQRTSGTIFEEYGTKKPTIAARTLFCILGRHTEFIIRRCFLPYVFLFFALFHIMNWLLIGATVGANVFGLSPFTPTLPLLRPDLDPDKPSVA